DVIALTDTIAAHAIQHNLAGPTLLNLADPVEHITPGLLGALRVATELIGAIALRSQLTVDADHDTLSPKSRAERIDQAGVCERGRVDRHLFGAGIQDFLSVPDRADPARNTEGNVQDARDASHPFAVHRTALRACRDVIKYKLVRALVAIASSELHNV